MTTLAILIFIGAPLAYLAIVKIIDRIANRKIMRAEIEYLGTGAESDRRQTIISYDNHTTII